MGVTCSKHVRKEKFMPRFGRKTLKKEISCET
jgi:hypothetical protein